MKIIEVTEKRTNKRNIKITYSSLKIDIEAQTFSASDIKVYLAGEYKTDFGETFAGRKFNAEDVLLSVILRYINGATSADFVVPDEIKAIKDSFFEQLTEVNGRQIPKHILGIWLNPMDVTYVDEEVSLYEDKSGNINLLDCEGELLTDIEALALDYVERNIESGLYKVYFNTCY